MYERAQMAPATFAAVAWSAALQPVIIHGVTVVVMAAFPGPHWQT
jgi:hypothetical protein